jgi:stage V sporulation protein AC
MYSTYAGAGAFIPISGFANALTSSSIEGRSEGLIFGIGSNTFKLAGSVLVYGISSAVVFSLIYYLLMLLGVNI